MGILDFIGDILGVSPPSSSESMSKEDIAWLMDQALTANRTNQQGLFSGFNWNESPDGTWTQSQTVNPALMPGIERLLGKASGPSEPYQSPEAFGGLMDALVKNRQHQFNLPQTGAGRNAQQPPERYVPLQEQNSTPAEMPRGGMGPPGGSVGGGGGGYWQPPPRNNLPRFDMQSLLDQFGNR